MVCYDFITTRIFMMPSKSKIVSQKYSTISSLPQLISFETAIDLIKKWHLTIHCSVKKQLNQAETSPDLHECKPQPILNAKSSREKSKKKISTIISIATDLSNLFKPSA